MKAKQTAMRLLLGLLLLTGVVASMLYAPTANAALCGGVTTSIVSCGQQGLCAAGENPYEGTQPSAEKTSIDAYSKKYGHDYGKCVGGVTPAKTLASTGVWGVLLLAINILTALIGLAAVAGVVYGSVLYTSAGGNQEQVKKAMGIITNVVIGVIAYALMYSVSNFLIPGGIFAT